jgi:hypothetical protein
LTRVARKGRPRAADKEGGKSQGRVRVRGLTSIIEEPVDVNGLLALLRLEDGACLLLPHQGLGIHCRRGQQIRAW